MMGGVGRIRCDRNGEIIRKMKSSCRSLAVVLVLALSLAMPAAARERFVPTRPGEVVFLRGLANIFSLGLDTLSEELKKYGVNSYVYNHHAWEKIGEHLIAKSRRGELTYPIVIIGHSYGANTALLMAYELRKMNIPVALLVFYDLTDSAKVPPNVDHVLNFRSSSSTGINVTVTGAAHFHGTIDNVTRADLNHITIDKQQDLHKQTIETIAKLFGKDARTSLN